MGIYAFPIVMHNVNYQNFFYNSPQYSSIVWSSSSELDSENWNNEGVFLVPKLVYFLFLNINTIPPTTAIAATIPTIA